MAWVGSMFLALALFSLTPARGAPAGDAASDLPPQGHARFDELIGAGPVPFPFSRLLARINSQLDSQLAPAADGLAPVKGVLIPLGRSLQRDAGAPDFFRFPRVLLAVDGATRPGIAPMKDRLFIGYHEKGAVLEVISYNEALGRFEFQLVRDYRPGGKAELVYARRALCLACHQNGAPIFARPLWDETPANPAIAARLRAVARNFYGIPPGGTDIAYFFDSATDRANLLPVWQRIWRDGCGKGEAGDACRQALFTAALRLALSGVLPERAVLAEVAPQLDRRWRQVWPKGLALPNPDLPNRDPLGVRLDDAAAEPRRAPLQRVPAELAGLGSIPARFEPLNPRPPLAIWTAPDKAELLSGLASLFAEADLVVLDQSLSRHSGQVERIGLECRVKAKADGRRSFQCQGARVSLAGTFPTARDKRGPARLHRFTFSGAPAGITLVANRMASSPASFQLRHGNRHARLADGRRLAELTIRQGRGSLTLVDDFARVNADLPSLRAATTFPAWDGMAELLSALSATPARPPLAALPPARVDRAVAASPGPVGAFRQRCGPCHDTPEAAPPNFLHGDIDVVATRLARCAPRIYYRLSMWDVAEDRRGKTPMPPLSALAGMDADAWARSPERRQLLAHASGLLLAQGVDPAGIVRRRFENLPACLPGRLAAPGK